MGFLVPSDSEASVEPCLVSNLDTDVGFVGGEGFIYGINRNFAVEFDITVRMSGRYSKVVNVMQKTALGSQSDCPEPAVFGSP